MSYNLVDGKRGHVIGTSMVEQVLQYNLASSFYREYVALSLAMIDRYFHVGSIKDAAEKILLMGHNVHGRLTVRWPLISRDSTSFSLAERLATPSGYKSFELSFSSEWLHSLLNHPDIDPLGDLFIRQPLKRIAEYRRDKERIAQFNSYKEGLWALADHDTPLLSSPVVVR